MNTSQTITQKDVTFIKEHKEQFAKPLLLLEKVSRLDLTKQEIMANQMFKEAIAELREIDRQGYKQQLFMFTNLVYNTDIF